MAALLIARYRSAADLARHLAERFSAGSLLLPLATTELQQFQAITLQARLPEGEVTLAAEVLQVLPGLGVVVQLEAPGRLLELVAGVASAREDAPPEVILAPDASAGPATAAREPPGAGADEGEEAAGGGGRRAGSSPLSWPFEKLQAEWGDLNAAERARVAKHGNRPARGLIMRMQDRTLHQILLSNPHISVEEVGVMAGMASADQALLKRILGSADWLRNKTVARNLLCHPKITLPQATRLVEYLADDELRRLTSTGKVRAAIKQIIVRKMEQRAGRR